jgi:leucyl aminopeptidase
MTLRFAEAGSDALPLHIIDAAGFDDWLAGQDAERRAWITASGFGAGIGQVTLLPGDPGGGPAAALAGYGTAAQRARGRFALAAAAEALPAGTYRIASGLPAEAAETEALGWLLSGYRFDRYRAGKDRGRRGADPRSDQHARLGYGPGRAGSRLRRPRRPLRRRDDE